MSAPPILQVWPEGILAARIPANNNSRLLQAIVLEPAISATTAAQPGSPAERDVYILPASPTGSQWSAFDEGDVVIFYENTWTAFEPSDGLRKFVQDEGEDWQFTGDSSGGWAPAGGGGGGGVQSVVAGTGISVDNTDPDNPIVAATGSGTTITVGGVSGIDEIALGTNLSGSAAGSIYTLDAAGGGGGGSTPVCFQYFGSGAKPSMDGKFVNHATTTRRADGLVPRNTGKRCVAFKVIAIGAGGSLGMGVLQPDCQDTQPGSTGAPGANKNSSWGLISSGGTYTGYNGSTSGSGPAPAPNDVVVQYVDYAIGTWWEINGTIMGGGDPVAGTSPTFSNIAGPLYPAASCAASGGVAAEVDIDTTSSSPFGATIRSGYTMWDV